MDAELVLDGHATHVVAGPQARIGVDHELRDDEQRDALDPCRRVGQACQHEVHDVVRHVVLAVGDEDLLPGDPVAAVRMRFGPRAHQRQVGAGLGFGQVHGPGPLAGHHLVQIALLQLPGARGQQGLDGAAGQQRAERERHVRGVDHLLDRRADHVRHGLAAEFGRAPDAVPSVLGEGLVGRLEACGRRDLPVDPACALAVADDVQRSQHLAAEPARLLEDGVHEIRRGVLVAGKRRDFGEACEFMQCEADVPQRWRVGAHGDRLPFQPSSAMSCGTATNRSATSP